MMMTISSMDDKEEKLKSAPARTGIVNEAESGKREKDASRKQKRGVSVAGSIIALIVGAAVLIAVILVVGKAAGLIGGKARTSSGQQEQQAAGYSGSRCRMMDMVSVPDLYGQNRG